MVRWSLSTVAPDWAHTFFTNVQDRGEVVHGFLKLRLCGEHRAARGPMWGQSCVRPLEPSRTEGLYIYYPHGGFYRAHLDAAPKGSGYFAEHRVFSYLLYLNDGWRVEHGGCLRLFPDGSDDGSFVDVEPRAGTLVVFRSDAVPHEVREVSNSAPASTTAMMVPCICLSASVHSLQPPLIDR